MNIYLEIIQASITFAPKFKKRWITATVLFAIYYAKGGWMQRCIAAQNAKTQG